MKKVKLNYLEVRKLIELINDELSRERNKLKVLQDKFIIGKISLVDYRFFEESVKEDISLLENVKVMLKKE